MWIHGYLHLIGYDHKKLDDYSKMFRRKINFKIFSQSKLTLTFNNQILSYSFVFLLGLIPPSVSHLTVYSI